MYAFTVDCMLSIQHRNSIKPASPYLHTCSFFSGSLPFTVGVEGAHVSRWGMIPNVSLIPFAQVVVWLVPRSHPFTTYVDGSMDMFERVGYSALCRHRVSPEHDSVADPYQPPACIRALMIEVCTAAQLTTSCLRVNSATSYTNHKKEP